jgi:hypothetical protein
MPVTEYGHRLATGSCLALEGGRGRERPPDWSAHRRAAQTPGQPEIAMLASNELRVGSYTCGIRIARRASRYPNNFFERNRPSTT